MNVETTETKNHDLVELVKTRITNLRPKLLDLSRRNPLVNTRFSARSNSYIRVVDELPNVLYAKLSAEDEMRFVPLPAIDSDPKDENSQAFKNALSAARLSDDQWKAEYDAIDSSADDSMEQSRKLERRLKNEIRAKLGMEPHQSGVENVSLAQHAKNNGISSSYDLPTSDETHADGRHTDTDIQTLLLPDELERKIPALITKCRSWEQETGISVLYAAFGFLEWQNKSDEVSISPLILMPVEIEKSRTKNGYEFNVKGMEESGEINTVLAEKLKQDFGIELPALEDSSPESYFERVAALSNTNWKVKRQIVFGVFPSARLAMYHDLDMTSDKTEINEAVQQLLAGSGTSSAALFGEEYDVDNPEISRKVQHLVLDADSSQYSAMVDIANGKNLAVEGPPGTGKSQTIVNTIANALQAGKKVLFIAEKAAALNVVKSRLESVELGEFILALQAEKSSREQVIQSIRERLDLSEKKISNDLYLKILKFNEIREQLQAYIDTLTTQHGATKKTIHELLGKGIEITELLESAPSKLREPSLQNVQQISLIQIDNFKSLGKTLKSAASNLNGVPSFWAGVKLSRLDRFAAGEICKLSRDAATHIRNVQSALEQVRTLEPFKTYSVDIKKTDTLLLFLQELSPLYEGVDLETAARLASDTKTLAAREFLAACKENQLRLQSLLEVFKEPPTNEDAKNLRKIHELISNGSEKLTVAELRASRERESIRLIAIQKLRVDIQEISSLVSDFKFWNLKAVMAARTIVQNTLSKTLKKRSVATASEDATELLSRCRKTCTKLLESKSELEKLVSFSSLKSFDGKLVEDLQQLTQAGIFSFLNPKFRESKSRYKAWSRRKNFTQAQAVADIQAVIELNQNEDKLCRDPELIAIFGKSLSVEMDFTSYEALLQYYDEVDAKISGLANKSLRKFLKEAEIEALQALPTIDESIEIENMESLEQEVTTIQARLAYLETTLEELSRVTSIFKAPDSASTGQMAEIAVLIEQYNDDKEVLERSTDASELLGSVFAGHKTEPGCLDKEIQLAVVLSKYPTEIESVLSLLKQGQTTEATRALENLKKAAAGSEAKLADFIKITGLDLSEKGSGLTLAEYLENASGDSDGLFAHFHFETALAELDVHKLGWIADSILKNEKSLDRLEELIEAVIYRAICIDIYKDHSQILSKSSGLKLDEHRSNLARLDKEILALTRKTIRSTLLQRCKAPDGIRQGRKSELTERALIDNEIQKKKRFISVRDLTHRAGQALLELKPCWMMSPLAVARYLRRGDIEFDLVIIDEASQMPPEDSLGAILRGKQVMVVGDTNQLPPTTFFQKMFDDEEIDEDEAVLEESILEIANAAFRPGRRLKWHYRSKHSSLIQFSNQMVYDGDLVVFPSAKDNDENMGVRLVQTNGLYSSGVNGLEAKAVVDAAVKFMKDNPKNSLGIVTLNQKQRDLILEEFEFTLANNNDVARYIERWKKENDGLETFFIKNLENVQGDERDVIFISTVYGPEKPDGPVMQRFGPINGVAGKRRLNVLFSRAKRQVVTFTSMTGESIKAQAHTNAGVYMLKKWLEYSANGQIDTGLVTHKSTDSPFEDYVIAQIKAMGFDTEPQVGVAGYFIDIGIKHPSWPYGFLLGVECDGANYHSSKSARDRDRLRQEVLEGLGWKLHRIWSTDWFNDPRREAERLRKVIDARFKEISHTIVPPQ